MAGVTNTQIMEYMTGMRGEINDVKEDIHKIDKAMGEHLVACSSRDATVSKLNKIVVGNGDKGLNERVNQLEADKDNRDKHTDLKVKGSLDVRTGVLISVITGAISIVGSIIGQHIIAGMP